MARYRLRVFADHHQFWLHDGDLDLAEADIEDLWSEETRPRRLALARSLIAVGTARPTFVRVELQVVRKPPNDDLSGWDAVLEGGIMLPSGQIVVRTTSDAENDEQALIDVRPGCYLARIYYGGLGTVTGPLEGNDHYKVVLWPVFQYAIQVLKRWQPKRRQRGQERA